MKLLYTQWPAACFGLITRVRQARSPMCALTALCRVDHPSRKPKHRVERRDLHLSVVAREVLRRVAKVVRHDAGAARGDDCERLGQRSVVDEFIAAFGIAEEQERVACTGNGLEDLVPSRRFDLWDAPPVNNLWQQNQGTSNF